MNKFAIIDNRYSKYFESLVSEGFEIIKTLTMNGIYEAVKSHADLQIAVDTNEKMIFTCENNYEYYGKKFKETEYSILSGELPVGSYPENVKYNVMMGKNLIAHNFKYTASEIEEFYKNKEIKKINVKQGYTKCSIVNMNGKYITDDENVYRNFRENGEEILKVRKGYVKLEGFEYGFIGGASGYYDGTLYFCGDVKKHPDYEAIENFAQCRIKILGSGDLTDVGTVILL